MSFELLLRFVLEDRTPYTISLYLTSSWLQRAEGKTFRDGREFFAALEFVRAEGSREVAAHHGHER